uniref:F-box domain-containing protein n=1 Tax=Setaria viridis TaxID=4556 RepID=A0A4U6U4S0_SETVI|nr:hypothetical protein SEVIR_6G038801v2 [Setaria viridis]
MGRTAIRTQFEAYVCALGVCSRSWRTTCDADCVWEHLFRCRWPAAAAEVAVASRVQLWTCWMSMPVMIRKQGLLLLVNPDSEIR